MDTQSLSAANFQQLMAAVCKKLGRDEALVLVDLSEDAPNSSQAYAIVGKETVFIPRDAIVAHGR